jgi:hypothetical protein
MRFSRDEKRWRRNMRGQWLLKDETVNGPDPLSVCILASLVGLGVVCVVMRVGCGMRVDERLLMRVMLVGRRFDRVVHVRVRGCGKPIQQGQYRSTRPRTAQHDSSIVSALSSGCQASTAAGVAVVVDHDKPGDEAIQVRFAAAK